MAKVTAKLCRTADDLVDIDVGTWFATDFKDERVPTPADSLDACKGKIGIVIELKYYGHDEQLEQRVADVVEVGGMTSDVMAMSLKMDGMKMACYKTIEIREDCRRVERAHGETL